MGRPDKVYVVTMWRGTIAELECVVAGGTDREGGGDGPAVVLFHGFGAPGDDLVSLSRVMAAPRGTRFVFPAAPERLGGESFGSPGLSAGPIDSRAWWMIDMVELDQAMREGRMRDLSKSMPDGLEAARDRADHFVTELCAQFHVPDHRLVLGGFSQGAMLAMELALFTDRPLAGLLQFSGSLLCADRWGERMAHRAGLRCVQSHGQRDPVLPFALAQELKDALTSAGWQLRWSPFQGQHEIPNDALDEAGHMLDEVLSP